MRNLASILAWILVIVGALNWLLIGIFSFNLVSFIFGGMSIASRVVYGLVGLAGIWLIGAAIVNACRSDRRVKD